jgi:hypothetical protein
MARTALTLTKLTANGSVADPAGNAVDPTNGHVLTLPAGATLEEIMLEVNLTFAGSKNLTVKAGANPPALEAGQGDLVVAINNAVKLIGPLTSGRFMQVGGQLFVDVEAASTGTIKAIRLPREA